MEMHKVWSMFESLPVHAKKEVIDFIAFLELRNKKSSNDASVSGKSDLRKQAFVGMWASNDKLKDSAAWVRKSRTDEWNN